MTDIDQIEFNVKIQCIDFSQKDMYYQAQCFLMLT